MPVIGAAARLLLARSLLGGPSNADRRAVGRGIKRIGKQVSAGKFIRVSVRTSGGDSLAGFLRQSKRNMTRLCEASIEVGFHDPRVAALAQIHERGRTGVPARPAFAYSMPMLRKAVSAAVRRELGMGTTFAGAFRLDTDAAQRIADAGADALRAGYLEFAEHGSPKLSARQARRKQHTRGRGKLLVGVQGPKLIGHISGVVRGFY